MKIDINGVSITLTKEQLAEIAKQTKNKYTIQDIADCITDESAYKMACKILDIEPLIINDDVFKSFNQRHLANKFLNQQILETIIKAANFIDNDYKEYRPNFNNHKEYKYIPWFEKKVSGGWLAVVVVCRFCRSYFSVGFYYKNENTAKVFQKRFINLYSQWLDN